MALNARERVLWYRKEPGSLGQIQTDRQTDRQKFFFDTIRRSPRGTGAGPSGWRYEHLKALLDNCSTADLLHSVCSSIASGTIPESALNLLTASRPIAIPKPIANGDVRPIAIGEALRHLTAKSICVQKKDSFTHFSALYNTESLPRVGQSFLSIKFSCYWRKTKTG